MLTQVYQFITILTLAVMSTFARTILPANTLIAIVDPTSTNTEDHHLLEHLFNIDAHHLSRAKRQTPNDYYANYYNDYYNNYYSQNSVNYQPRPPSADRFDDNSNFDKADTVIDGQKFVYTPLFQYKATQQKKHKLFVPNLFG